MPMYRFQCPECEELERVFRSVDNRNDDVQCESCETSMVRDWLNENKGAVILRPYVDPHIRGDGEDQLVKGPGHKRKLKRQFGMRELGSFVE